MKKNSDFAWKKITYGEWGHIIKKKTRWFKNGEWGRDMRKKLGNKNEEKLLIDYITLYNKGEWGHSLSEKIVYFNEKKIRPDERE